MVRILLLLILLSFGATPVLGQQPHRPRYPEIAVVAQADFDGNAGFIGVQLEPTSFKHILPWISVLYGTRATICTFTCSTIKGAALVSGARLRVKAAKVEPYINVGAGVVWWMSRRYEPDKVEWVAGMGLKVTASKSIRPRIEYGRNANADPALTVGIGIGL